MMGRRWATGWGGIRAVVTRDGEEIERSYRNV